MALGLLTLLMAVLGCLGIVISGQSFRAGQGASIAGLFGCVFLVIPVLNLIGALCGGVAVATAPKKSVAWLAVILNGVQLLALLAIGCIGLIARGM
ncbi:MAG: hypothetical protein ACREJ2_18085 [Planctomycetota bacterium]